MEQQTIDLTHTLQQEEARHHWWQTGIVYQIYPRSFQDSNGDGVGDLAGIVQRLDYLQWLGVSAVWVSPIYPSPMADFGYDVSDYCGIHPLFGTMADFDRLLEETHRRDMKLILDLVPNHTSNEHPWFLESRSSRDNPKRDWYIWQDPAPDGGLPNNWLSVFGGPGWEWDEATGQFYYHAFLKEQPDLNWRNPEVQQAMLGVMKFWLDKGVDGFRVDVMYHMIKDAHFRDNPKNPNWTEGESSYNQHIPAFSTDQPEVHDIVQMMRRLTDSYEGDRVIIGEIWLPIGQLVTYYGPEMNGAHLPFNFQLLLLPWEPQSIDAAISEYEAALPPEGWPNWVLGNHDKARIASRIGERQARVAGMMLLTLRGTPTMYYGDEIGMVDYPIPPELVQDPQEINEPGKGLGRDPERTPMQWDASQYAGFSTVKPWLPVHQNHAAVNVASQRDDPHSTLTFYRRLIQLRQSERALCAGIYRPVEGNDDVICFIREAEGHRQFLVALNLTGRPLEQPLKGHSGRIVLTTGLDRDGETVSETLRLEANEGVVVELEG